MVIIPLTKATLGGMLMESGHDVGLEAGQISGEKEHSAARP